MIVIGENCTIKPGCNINCESNSTITIGENCTIGNSNILKAKCNSQLFIGKKIKLENSYIGTTNYSRLTIGDNCRIGRLSPISCDNNSTISIGKNTSIGVSSTIIAFVKSTINIGEDCMISYYVNIRSDDGHTIFDIKNQKDINDSSNRKISIGNHVWVGMSATILYDALIGNGSIVGANSLVKSTFPNNCILVGIPAKISRKDVAWSRENNIDYNEFIELYGEDSMVISLTEE